MNQAMNAIDRLMENYGNDKFNAAITATKYAVANQNIIRLNEAASMFEALRDEAWDGSYKDIVKVNGKTVTVPTSATAVTENGRKIVKSGTLITDAVLGKGLLVNDADITDGARVGSMMIRGSYIDANLPTSVADSATTLAAQGLYAIAYPETEIAYGEVNA
jgi:hypothetical protein